MQVFFCELKDIFFAKHLRTSASAFLLSTLFKATSNAIAKSHQVNYKYMRFNLFLAKARSYNDKFSG